MIGLGAPKSLQEWPPGPRTITSKRRLPRASATMVSAPGAIDNDAVGNRIAPARRCENMTHAAQIAFAFFSDVADEDIGQRVRNARACQHTGHGQHRGNARAVVGNSGAIQAAALLPDIQRRGRRKHGIDVRAERNVSAAVAGTNAEHVADFVRRARR